MEVAAAESTDLLAISRFWQVNSVDNVVVVVVVAVHIIQLMVTLAVVVVEFRVAKSVCEWTTTALQFVIKINASRAERVLTRATHKLTHKQTNKQVVAVEVEQS